MSKLFSQSDVSAHKKPDDLWVIVDDDVYDLTTFQTEHPGELAEFNLVSARLTTPQVARRVGAPSDVNVSCKSDHKPQYYSEWVAKMHRSNSGNTIMRASSRNTRVSYRWAHWIAKNKGLHQLHPKHPHPPAKQSPRKPSSRLRNRGRWLPCQERMLRRRPRHWISLAPSSHTLILRGIRA